VSRDEYFLKVKSALSVYAPMDFKIFWRLVKEKNKIKFLPASMKLLTNVENHFSNPLQ
jgi:hypothetical protein